MTQLHWSAASRLLDRDIQQDYLDERTAIVSAENKFVETGTKSAVIFRIGSEWLALSTTVLQEVAELGKVHTLPHRAEGVLRGLVNVRGELLLCVALDALLGIEVSPAINGSAQQSMMDRLMVCNHQGNRLAFVVNEVHGVHHFHPRDLTDIPATLARSAVAYTSGVLHWNRKTVGCLDDQLVFYGLNKGLA